MARRRKYKSRFLNHFARHRKGRTWQPPSPLAAMALSECPRWRATKNLALNKRGPCGPDSIGRTATVYRVCSGLLGFFGGAANDRDGCPAVSIIAANGDQETHGGAIVAGDHSAVGGLEKVGLGVELAAVERHDLSRGITGLE